MSDKKTTAKIQFNESKEEDLTFRKPYSSKKSSATKEKLNDKLIF